MAGTPTTVRRSLIIADLIFMSMGASTAREGDRFTFSRESEILGKVHCYLNQPGLKVRVHENIKPVKLKTIVPMGDEHLTGRIDRELDADDRLDDHVFDALHQLHCVNVIGLEVLEEGAEGPFVTLIIKVGVTALDVIRVVLVDGVIAEVHARVPQVLPRVVVLHRGKSGIFIIIIVLSSTI